MAAMPDAFPVHGLLPKDETEATAFLTKYPQYDGRNTVVAILDTGVCPAAPGLQTTTDGKPKLIDIVDCTGGGDVLMSDPVPLIASESDASLRTVKGLSGRTLHLNADWSIPSKTVRLGIKRGLDLFPGPVQSRVTADAKHTLLEQHAQLDAKVRGADKTTDETKKEDLDALKSLADAVDPVGPVYDVIAFHDGTHWRVVVDTAENGKLESQPALASYRFEHQYHRFGDLDNLTFSVNVYDGGKTVSLVTQSGAHGTHVAAITAAHHPEEPHLNGLAPGAQLVSLRIGDARLGSMETGPALARAVLSMVQNKVDLANMSYGEAAHVPNAGRFVELVRDIAVRRHGVIFVASAGNAGPALSTSGAPGGCTSGVISVGAHVGAAQMAAEYALVHDRHGGIPPREYTWTSRGPTTDGDWGVDVYAPGSAVTSVPSYQLAPNQLMNGTSMSSPNACGNFALLVSGWKAEVGMQLTPARLLKAVQATGTPVATDPFKRPFLQTDKAFAHLLAHRDARELDVAFNLSIGDGKARGIYLRGYDETHAPLSATVNVKPDVPLPPIKNDWAELYHAVPEPTEPDTTLPAPTPVSHDDANALKLAIDLRLALVATAPWVRVPAFATLTHEGRGIPVEVDTPALGTGLHVAAIEAWDTTAPKSKGPLFTVPVTVCKPVRITDTVRAAIKWENVATGPGTIERKFVAVPAGASFVDVFITTRSPTPSPAVFYVRTLQLVPHTRYPTYGQTYRITIGNAETEALEPKRHRVVPGVTMEVTLAQWWAAASPHSVDVELVFHGINVTPPATAALAAPIVQGNGIVRLDVHSQVRREENVQIGINVDKLRKWVRAKDSSITPLSATRDVTPSARATHQLVLTYAVPIAENGTSITPSLPGLANVLYDAPYEAYLLMVSDVYQRTIAFHDMYPKSVKLDKGEYTVRVQVRHDDAALLERLSNLPLAVDVPAKGVSVDLFPSFADAVKKGSKWPSKVSLNRGESRALFAVVPAEVKDANPGDLLLGSVTVGEGGRSNKIDGGFGDVAIPVTNPAGAKDKKPASGGSQKEKPSLADQVRDVQIAHYKTLTKDADAAARADLEAALDEQHGSHLPYLQAKLDVAAATKGDVAAAADAVLAAIDRADLAAQLMLAGQAKTSAAARGDKDAETAAAAQVKAAEARRDALVAAAQKKAVTVLGDALVPADGGETWDAAIREWRQWRTNPDGATSLEQVKLLVAELLGASKKGAAVKAVLKYLADTPKTPANADDVKGALALKTQVLREVGWDVWADHEEKWGLVRFPKALAPF
ncbi:tripeptidyl-peptidase II Tpp2 [Allomyces javanicus]|nr:tripeptidyl-peptidase II Tpp2 [Allomyces javanicus]